MAVLKNINTLADIFVVTTQDFGKGLDRPVFKHKVDGQYVGISYDKFYDETENFAMGLASMGVKRDNKVAMISENRPKWAYSDFAIISLGAVNVPLYPISTAENIEFILNNSEAVSIIVSNKFHLNKVLKIRDKCKYLKFIVVMNDADKTDDKDVYAFHEIQDKGKEFKSDNPKYLFDSIGLVKPDDLATIIYTSGTTGVPKGVMLTHNNILSNVKAAHEVFVIDDNDIFLSFLPLCHIFERMVGYYTCLSAGGMLCFAESIEKLSINMMEIKPTLMAAVPRLFERMYSKIRKNVESQPAKKQKIFDWAISVGQQYSETKKSDEAIPVGLNLKQKLADKLVFGKLRQKTGGKLRFFISGGAALSRELGEFFDAAGMLVIEGYGLTESSPVITCNRLNDYKFGSVGKTFPGVEVKIAKDGEILAYGPNIMPGYFKNKKETEDTLKDGWLHTGDIGVFDAEGFLIITDRKKHLFKTSGGKYIAPSPIENMFLASKYIEQFVLIGDRRMFVTALIVPDFEALAEYADAHRIPYSDPKELTQLKQIYELLEKDLAQFQGRLANFERVRKFTILENPFSIESGEMTPSLKLKRKVIEERYDHLIDDMYKALGN